MEIKSSIAGAKELEALMKRMPKAMRTKAGLRSLAAGASVVKKAAIVNVKAATSGSKDSTGTLANGLRIYKMKTFRGMLRVGVMVKKGLVNKKKIINGTPVRVGLYASVLDYGKANQAPTGWLRSAASKNQSDVFSAVEAEITRQMDKIVEAAR